MKNNLISKASFRDPNGFIFYRENCVYRQINRSYARHYDYLMASGLYQQLTKLGLLVSHLESDALSPVPGQVYKTIQPETIPFISYPYEWPFGFLKSAALATLSIQKKALKKGMSLKDASAYNIQFFKGKATLIDTLSFELYKEGEPWIAYRQFCQHFLAPLALMAYTDVRLGQLLRVFIDGIPLDLASTLLPFHTKLNLGLLVHLHIHSRAQKKYENKEEVQTHRQGKVSKESLMVLLESLENTIKKMNLKSMATEWGNYYDITNYTNTAFLQKKTIVSDWIAHIKPNKVWDLGANDGTFSRLASEKGIHTIAFDIDPTAVEKNYQNIISNQETHLLSLLLDLTNPSPAIGWHNRERETIFDRSPADVIFALAIIHHLAIANNVPLPMLADFFADLGSWLIIEFVPKSDSQVQKLLKSRVDIFPEYTTEKFEISFAERFDIIEKILIAESDRYLYLMRRKL